MKSFKEKVKLRIFFLFILFILAWSILFVRLIYLHFLESKRVKSIAKKQYKKILKISGRRGSIFDRSGNILAISIEVESLFAMPKKIKNKSKLVNILSSILKEDKNTLLKKLSKSKSFVFLKRKLSPKIANKIKSYKFLGLDFLKEEKRFYPNKTLAGQLLGFVGEDNHGLEGIEYFYDKFLKGSDERITALKDGLGRIFLKDLKIPTGCDLYLTIDQYIQYETEKALEKDVRK